MSSERINLQSRIPVKSLKVLAMVFKGNPHRDSTSEIAKAAGVSSRAVRELNLLCDRRPDLLEQVFTDQLSLYRASKIMRSDRSKWQVQQRTRF